MARRYRLRHPDSPLARWVRRVLGMAGTAVLLGVAGASAAMILARDDDQVVTPAPASTGVGDRQHERLTARRRADRRRAADAVRRRGYAPVALSDYRADHVLRVLIGKPAGSTPKGLRAFFFARREYIGQDATSPSLRLRPGRQLDREITLVYTLYEAGDRECCPRGGDMRVHFRWTGGALEPREQIPPDYQRLPAELPQ